MRSKFHRNEYFDVKIILKNETGKFEEKVDFRVIIPILITLVFVIRKKFKNIFDIASASMCKVPS